MTLSKAQLVEQLAAPGGRRGGPKQTIGGDLLVLFRRQLAHTTGITWPAPQYRRQYVRFAREILGIEPWSEQRRILEACSEYDRVAVKSGHRVGKSQSAAIIALCDYCAIEEMRVVMSSGTARQVDEVLWRAIGMLHERSGRCVVCKAEDPDGISIPRPCPHSAVIDGTVPMLARTGLRSPKGSGYRQIFGFSAKEGGKITGVAGAEMRFVFDEAAAIPDEIYDANEGNRAGGAWIVLFGNPIKNKGHFREAFRTIDYHRITVSSERSPNITGERVIKGLATEEWIEERKREWGEHSPLYITKVKGEFAENAEGRIFPPDAITAAEERWHSTPAEGRLWIGFDPAGTTETGDESVYCVRRGLKVLGFWAFRGLNPDARLAHLLSLLMEHRKPNEQAAVNIDREGAVGAETWGTFRAYLATQSAPPFVLSGIRASEKARRQPKVYDRVRDELAANLVGWFREGGAIPEDLRLAADLGELSWSQNHRGLEKLTPKDDIRKELGRSPDRYDALALACWEPLSLREQPQGGAKVPTPPKAPADPYAYRDHQARSARGVVDPYAHYDAQRRGR